MIMNVPNSKCRECGTPIYESLAACVRHPYCPACMDKKFKVLQSQPQPVPLTKINKAWWQFWK
jgi:Zn finger protein HypA/HybF involved in hydrogenase expression